MAYFEQIVADAPNANNTYGSVSGIIVGNTANVVNILSTAAGYKLRGFQAQGQTDAVFYLNINGVPKYFGRINETQKTFSFALPNPDSVTTGSQVTLTVTNEGGATAFFEGTILGE
jgi:hypothetical protein